jgi:hypothetical protein
MDPNQPQHDDEDALPGDLLVGATAIAAFLRELGMPEETDEGDVYYYNRTGQWPIGKTNPGKGGKLIASKKRFTRHARKITAPAS